MYQITFKFEEKGKEPITIQNCAVDDSVLEVALKNVAYVPAVLAIFI
jgi:hypothetical protein